MKFFKDPTTSYFRYKMFQKISFICRDYRSILEKNGFGHLKKLRMNLVLKGLHLEGLLVYMECSIFNVLNSGEIDERKKLDDYVRLKPVERDMNNSSAHQKFCDDLLFKVGQLGIGSHGRALR